MKTMITIAAFIAGVCTIPLAIIAWPFVLATMAWNEHDDTQEDRRSWHD